VTTHLLRVAAKAQLTDDAVAIDLDVPDHLVEAFRWTAGQHVLVGREGTQRAYSICVPPGAPRLRIGVKKIVDGAMSPWLNDELRAGDSLDVATPRGHFTVPFDPAHRKRYVAITAGSGITPILSLISTALELEPQTSFVLVYANRDVRSIMFLEEIADLKDRYLDRFEVLHCLSREAQYAELHSGRLDSQRLRRILVERLDAAAVDEWFLCGPAALVDEARAAIVELTQRPERVHREVFHADPAPPRPSTRPAAAAATAVVTLGGRTGTVVVDPSHETILDAVLAARSDAPYACRGGVCGTCRAKLVEGTVEMDVNYALEPEEIEDGFVLTCQSHPTSDRVVVDYDA